MIRIDVDRTFQRLNFFHSASTRATLENVLFVWSMNHELGYRQGMNEIVGVLVYHGLTEEETADSLADWEHIEPDVYSIFEKLMQSGLGSLYTSNEQFRLKGDDFFTEMPNLDRSSEEDMSISIRKCHYIFHRILRNADNELYMHILRQKFEPQLFLIRWIRCLLCREFAIENIWRLWDVIFSFNCESSVELEMMNYLCAAMLVKARGMCKK